MCNEICQLFLPRDCKELVLNMKRIRHVDSYSSPLAQLRKLSVMTVFFFFYRIQLADHAPEIRWAGSRLHLNYLWI